MRDGTNRVVFWDFDGTLAFREGLWSSTLEKALQPIAPELGLIATDFRDELSVSFPWHAPDIVRVTQSRNAILSNHAPELPQLVTNLGLAPWIDITITSAAVGAEKPNPRIFDYAIKATGAGGDVRMVGDNPVADVAGAEAVDIRAIHVGPHRTLTDATHQIVESVRQARFPENPVAR